MRFGYLPAIAALTAMVCCPARAQQAQGSPAAPAAASAATSGTAAGPAVQAPEFSDDPKFRIAGVTDWTAVGGHGSDATLRTSEEMARETLSLGASSPGLTADGSSAVQNGCAVCGRIEPDPTTEKRLLAAAAAAPASAERRTDLGEYYLRAGEYGKSLEALQSGLRLAGGDARQAAALDYDLALACRALGDPGAARAHIRSALAEHETAEADRLAGNLEEQLGDPLAAVRLFERAVALSPTEENYFAWASELLVHRAIWQAVRVFARGAEAYPRSVRLQTGWAAALFAGDRYAEAAERLCAASDLAVSDPEPYLFLARLETAAPAPAACVEPKLERFARLEPSNAVALYSYATALVKGGGARGAEDAQALLVRAVMLDPGYAEAYLALGVLAFDRREYADAVELFKKASAAKPDLAEVYYRLGVTYERLGDKNAAAAALKRHDELVKAQAELVEKHRREVKQFSFESQDASVSSRSQ